MKTADAIKLGIWYASTDFKNIAWSDHMKNHFWIDLTTSADAEVIISRVHEDDRAHAYQSILNTLEHNTPFDITIRTISPLTSEVKHLQIIGWTNHDHLSGKNAFDGIAIDITKNVVMFEDAREQQWRYEMALKASNDLIWDWDLEEKTFIWSEALHSHYGWPKGLCKTDEEWIFDLIQPESKEYVRQSLNDAFREKKKYWKAIYKLKKADGTYLDVIDHGYILYNEQGTAVRMVGSYHDITEQKNNLEKLEEAIKVRDNFLSIASHELKTPLTSMILQLQVLKKKLEKEEFSLEKFKKGIELNIRQSKILATLIEQMLDVSRVESGKMQIHSGILTMGEVVKSAIEAYLINVQVRGVELHLEIEKNCKIRGDSFKLEQVVYNLVSNALKYGNKSPVTISVYKEGEYSILSVKDEGLGIPEGKLSTIFNLFERGDAPGGISGLGLGLYICKEIIKMHNGDIEVESKIGKGSNFKVILPAYKPSMISDES